MVFAMTCTPKRIKRVAAKAAKARANWAREAATYNYMNNDNAGWGTDRQIRAQRLKRDRLAKIHHRAEVAVKAVVKNCMKP